MSAVSNLLEIKGSDVLSVSPDQLVKEAIVKMAEISAGTVVVKDGESVVGIMSERDVIRKVVLEGKSVDTVKVQDIMSTELSVVSAQTSVESCMQTMTEKRIRHLPVMCGEVLCGLVSIGDVVKYISAQKELKIKNLESYVTGSL